MPERVVIRAEGLSKRYSISHRTTNPSYASLRDLIVQSATRAGARLRRPGRATASREGAVEEFWALKKVDFTIRQGDVVGVIGRNGAGKSTLLKVLSRITEPTAGRVSIEGRVASLLEVGTGFHPELTGRENIFLNGAILGMRRSEIRRKFDQIVDFAEVERFLDTPVKRFSSGMYVRLAFAVAAHLEPEILIVDEVLAVGDADFQRKCLGKMSEVAGGGRTVLFVSHNLSAIETLCSRAIYLANGSVVQEGCTLDVVSTYLGRRDTRLRRGAARAGPTLELLEISTSPEKVRTGDLVSFGLSFQASSSGQLRECALLIYTLTGVRVALIDLREFGYAPTVFKPGKFSFSFVVEDCSLSEGDYALGAYVVADEFAGDLLEMQDLHVGARRTDQDFAPYAASARGFVSLNAAAVRHQVDSPDFELRRVPSTAKI